MALNHRRIRSRWETVIQHVPAQWWSVVVVYAGLLQYDLLFPIEGTRTIAPDSATFFYGGGLLAEGYAPYLYWWDVKPPLIYDTTALIALIAPHQPWVQFYLGSMLSAMMALASVVLVGMIVYRLTRSNLAAFTAGVVLCGYWHLFYLSVRGIFPKTFVLAFGLTAIWYSLAERHLIAAVCGTIATGYWQFGAIFAVIAFGRAWKHDRSLLPRMIAASVLTTLISIAPIVLLGGGLSMLYQVIVVPVLMGDRPQTFLMRLTKFTTSMPLLWPIWLTGIAVGVEHVIRTRRHYWLAGGLGWSLVQLGVLDFDTRIDAILLVVFCALAVGVFVGDVQHQLTRPQLAILIACLCLLPVSGVYSTIYAGDNPYYLAPHPDVPNRNGMAEVDVFLAQEFPPETCVTTRWWYSHQLKTRDGEFTRSTPQRCTPGTTFSFATAQLSSSSL